MLQKLNQLLLPFLSFFFWHCDILLLRGQTEPFETLALTVLGHDANQSNYDHLLVGLIMS